MSKEQLQSENKHENTGKIPSLEESQEAIDQKRLEVSQKEVSDFMGEAGDGIKKAESIASADGLQIDEDGKEELNELNQKVEAAQGKLEEEISAGDSVKDERGEKFSGFIKHKKEFYRKNDMEVVKEATHGKKGELKEAEFIKGYIEEYMAKAEEIRSEIENKKSSIINRVLEFRKIKELEKKLNFNERVLEDNKRRLAQKLELADAYDYMIAEEIKLSAIMEEAHKENTQWDENKRLELIKEEDRRDVSKLAEEHGVFFCHDIVDAEWKPSANNNAINTKELDFNNQLDILHGLDPTISVSTLHEGSKQRTFGKGSWGVFLSGGRVLGGEKSDAGSVAYGLRDRRFCSTRSMTTESIEDAICGREDSSSYNELVVENPEIAGVYVKWDDEMPDLVENNEVYLKNENGVGYDRWWDQLSDVMKRGMPLFVLNQNSNTVRLMYDVDIKNRSFKVTPEYNPKNFVDMPGIYQQHLGKEEKRKAAMRVFDKAAGLIPEDERSEYAPDGTERDGRGLYNVN